MVFKKELIAKQLSYSSMLLHEMEKK